MLDIQKAGLTKRFAAFLLDFILISIVIAGALWGLSAAFGIETHATNYFEKQSVYAKEAQKFAAELETLPLSPLENDKEYDALPAEEKAKYEALYYTEAYSDRYLELFNADTDALYAQNMFYNLILITTISSIFLAFLLLEFILPLIFKNGQTVGKKVMGIAVIHQNGVRASHIAIFTRALLGKFVLEAMVPLILIVTAVLGYTGWVGFIVLGLFCILEIFVFFMGRKYTPLHDVIGSTICVDNASQMVFDSTEELMAYKAARHREEIRDSRY